MAERDTRAPAYIVSLAGFLLLALAWTWPVAAHASTHVPHDLRDPVLVTWILWWNAHVLPLTAAWWSPPILIPMHGALALSEHLIGLSPFAVPIQLSGGSPLLAYNVCLILSYALSGWFAYLLVFRLTGSTAAAICGGVAFATAPYRAGQLEHLQVLTSQWMPAMLLGMHGYLSSGRRRYLALFAASWLLQALSNGYYLMFLPVLIALWLAWFVDWRRAPQRGLVLVATWLVASLPLVPILLEYRSVHQSLGLSRLPADVLRYSATITSFFHASPQLVFWPARSVRTQEDYLFPGVTAIAVTILGLMTLVTRARAGGAVATVRSSDRCRAESILVFYAMATIAMWAFTFGPGQETAGLTVWLRPYRWLTRVAGYDGLRVPARFAMLSSLCLAISAGLAIARLRSIAHRAVPVMTAIVLAGLTLDGLMQPVSLLTPPADTTLPASVDGVVLELPVESVRVNTAAMYRSIHHGRPILNGYSGYRPPHFEILTLALRRGDPSPLEYFARGRPLIIIVNRRLDAGGRYTSMMEAIPSIERIGATSVESIYRLPAQPLEAPPVSGVPLAWRPRDAGGERLEIDLETTRVVHSTVFNLRSRYRELSEQLLIERSNDGKDWETAWHGWTGAPAVAAAIEDPLVAPVRLPLSDVRARYLRLYPAPAWLASELAIVGQ